MLILALKRLAKEDDLGQELSFKTLYIILCGSTNE